MFRKILVIIITIFISNQCYSGTTEYGDITGVKVVRVYDGDSITVNIPSVHPLLGKTVGVRIAHIDTPELRGKCENETLLAEHAKALVVGMIPADKVITLRHVRRDMYFRILADVEMGGVDVGSKLVELGVAYNYEGLKKQSWCGN